MALWHSAVVMPAGPEGPFWQLGGMSSINSGQSVAFLAFLTTAATRQYTAHAPQHGQTHAPQQADSSFQPPTIGPRSCGFGDLWSRAWASLRLQLHIVDATSRPAPHHQRSPSQPAQPAGQDCQAQQGITAICNSIDLSPAQRDTDTRLNLTQEEGLSSSGLQQTSLLFHRHVWPPFV